MSSVVYNLSKNFLGITRAYVDEVLLPTLVKVGNENAPQKVTIVLADKCLCLLFYSPVLAERILPAFAHLEKTQREPDLTIHIWDSCGTEVELVQPYYKKKPHE